MAKYTWGEIQIESLKKMFLNNTSIFEEDLEDMKNDNKYKIYLNAMPQAANEGIAELMKRSKPHIETITFTQFPPVNVLNLGFDTFEHKNDLEFIAEVALSYYYEIDNMATVEIYLKEDGEWILQKTLESRAKNPGKYSAFKGFITNPNHYEVKILFKGQHPYHVRNIALYDADYDYFNGNTKYIPDFKPYNIYNLKSLASNYYKLYKIYHEDENHELMNRNDFIMEDGNTLVLNNALRGNFILKYQTFQEKITLDTDSETEINLDEEVAVILPLYIASQLYKDDDIAVATMYRNEFETALEDLYPKYNDLKFVDKTGWL